MIKAVLFDLDGVLLHGKYASDYFGKTHGIPIKDFVDVIRNEINNKSNGGTFEVWQKHLKKWGVEMSETKYFDTWFKVEETEAIDENIRLVEKLAKLKIKVGIVSDNFIERAKWLESTFAFMKKLDHKFFSCYLGSTKAETSTFSKILDELGLKPDEVIFIDDDPSNLKSAVKIGIKSIHYENPDKLLLELIKTGVKVESS